MIRILIADDHPILRAGIKRLVDEQPDMHVTAEASTGDEVLELAQTRDFDIVLLDVSMPHKNGFDCLKLLRQFNKDLPVLVVSVHAANNYAGRMLQAGANGYLSKNNVPEQLIGAIRTVLRGDTYLAENIDLASGFTSTAPKNTLTHLSEREFQIFIRLASGERTTEIAKDLNLNARTITTYRNRVLEKLALRSNADLTHYAMKNDLLE